MGGSIAQPSMVGCVGCLEGGSPHLLYGTKVYQAHQSTWRVWAPKPEACTSGAQSGGGGPCCSSRPGRMQAAGLPSAGAAWGQRGCTEAPDPSQGQAQGSRSSCSNGVGTPAASCEEAPWGPVAREPAPASCHPEESVPWDTRSCLPTPRPPPLQPGWLLPVNGSVQLSLCKHKTRRPAANA